MPLACASSSSKFFQASILVHRKLHLVTLSTKSCVPPAAWCLVDAPLPQFTSSRGGQLLPQRFGQARDELEWKVMCRDPRGKPAQWNLKSGETLVWKCDAKYEIA